MFRTIYGRDELALTSVSADAGMEITFIVPQWVNLANYFLYASV